MFRILIWSELDCGRGFEVDIQIKICIIEL